MLNIEGKERNKIERKKEIHTDRKREEKRNT